jgi:cytochrome b561
MDGDSNQARPLTPTRRWSILLRWAHALTAVVILAMLGLGWIMNHGGLNPAHRFEFYQVHKSAGFLLMALVLVRLATRLAVGAPPPVGRPWQRRGAMVVHGGLYGLMIAMPLVGWAMVSATPLPMPITVFGVWSLPPLLAPDLALYLQLKRTHQLMGWMLVALVALHVAGAALHRDAGLVKAMWRLSPART